MISVFTQVRARLGGTAGEVDEARHTIDYMWLSEGSRVRVERVLALPALEELGPARLPSASAPSDHLPLAADLSLSFS